MSVAKRRLHLLEESAEDESELSWGYERAPEGMPGSLPWGDPSRTRCFENEAYEAPFFLVRRGLVCRVGSDMHSHRSSDPWVFDDEGEDSADTPLDNGRGTPEPATPA